MRQIWFAALAAVAANAAIDMTAAAQTAPAGAAPPAPAPLTIVQLQVTTVDRMLAMLQMDGGTMATGLAEQIRKEAIPQIQAYQSRQADDAKAVADAKGKAEPAKPEPAKAEPAKAEPANTDKK